MTQSVLMQMVSKVNDATIIPSFTFPIPAWVRWLAQDSSGVWWGYSVEPLRNDNGWYENEVGDYIRLGCTAALGWEESLIEWPVSVSR